VSWLCVGASWLDRQEILFQRFTNKLPNARLKRLSNNDDVEQSSRTFASEMATFAIWVRVVKSKFEHASHPFYPPGLATRRSLDELGRAGTFPCEGVGISRAIAEALNVSVVNNLTSCGTSILLYICRINQ